MTARGHGARLWFVEALRERVARMLRVLLSRPFRHGHPGYAPLIGRRYRQPEGAWRVGYFAASIVFTRWLNMSKRCLPISLLFTTHSELTNIAGDTSLRRRSRCGATLAKR